MPLVLMGDCTSETRPTALTMRSRESFPSKISFNSTTPAGTDLSLCDEGGTEPEPEGFVKGMAAACKPCTASDGLVLLSLRGEYIPNGDVRVWMRPSFFEKQS